METKTKNAIVLMIEAMNADAGRFKQYEIDLTKEQTGRKIGWSISIFQFSRDKDTGEVKYSDLLSDPSDILMLAKAVGAGHYISVDRWKVKRNGNILSEDFKALPYVRLF
jgi:hypothetical protein